MRSEVEKGTELGQQLDAKMKTGSLASDDQASALELLYSPYTSLARQERDPTVDTVF